MELGKHLAREAAAARPVGTALLKKQGQFGRPRGGNRYVWHLNRCASSILDLRQRACLHRPFWTCFSLKNKSDLDLKYGDNRRVCVGGVKTGVYRPFSTFENGRVCMCIKKGVYRPFSTFENGHSRPSKTDILDLRKRTCLYLHEKRCVSSIPDLRKRTFSTFKNGRV